MIPVNFGGQWKKIEDGSWNYDAQKSKYIKVHMATAREILDINVYLVHMSSNNLVSLVCIWSSMISTVDLG